MKHKYYNQINIKYQNNNSKIYNLNINKIYHKRNRNKKRLDQNFKISNNN